MRNPLGRYYVLFVTVIVLISGCGHSGGRTPIVLPEARNTRLIIDGGPDVLVIITHDPITKQDNFELDGDNIPRLEMFDKFRESTKERGDPVLIKAAPDVRYGSVLDAMDAANVAGFTKFAFVNRVQGSPTDGDKPVGFQKTLQARPPRMHFDRRHSIEVEITKKNQIWIDRRVTEPEKLYSEMNHAVAYHRAQGFSDHISLVADQDVSWTTIIHVLDAARQAGDDDVGFVTQ